ncbi:hypothetical protein AMS68_006721 [Peltaster fructicola]|uniref:Uncharacterized protein n=1 Tax=Peltaster fructicola TaxID=286661 RepID=A0A6H0Y2G2_9PEZI|nr:hypothetical protein AMS68_006721 [Peltaster fructicola]
MLSSAVPWNSSRARTAHPLLTFPSVDRSRSEVFRDTAVQYKVLEELSLSFEADRPDSLIVAKVFGSWEADRRDALAGPLSRIRDEPMDDLDGALVPPHANAEVHRQSAKLFDAYFDFDSFDNDRKSVRNTIARSDSATASTDQEKEGSRTVRQHTQMHETHSKRIDVSSDATTTVEAIAQLSAPPEIEGHSRPDSDPHSDPPIVTSSINDMHEKHIGSAGHHTPPAPRVPVVNATSGVDTPQSQPLVPSTHALDTSHRESTHLDQAIEAAQEDVMQARRRISQVSTSVSRSSTAVASAPIPGDFEQSRISSVAELDTITAPPRGRKRAAKSVAPSSRTTRAKVAKLNLERKDTLMEGQLNDDNQMQALPMMPRESLDEGARKADLGEQNVDMKDDPNVEDIDDQDVDIEEAGKRFDVPRPDDPQHEAQGYHRVGTLELKRLQDRDPTADFWKHIADDAIGARKTRAQLAADKATTIVTAPSRCAAKKRRAKK